MEEDTPFKSSRPVLERGTVTLCVGKRSVGKASHELRVATVGEAGGGRAEERTSGPDPGGRGQHSWPAGERALFTRAGGLGTVSNRLRWPC